MIEFGFEPVTGFRPRTGTAGGDSEYARWTPIIKKLGFKVQ